MATAKKEAVPAPALAEPSYPGIEGFIEAATADQVNALFAPVKESLAALKGPKVEAAKKVGKAIERTEELLSYLLQVREKLETEKKGAKGRR
jgi:hypothetical protein